MGGIYLRSLRILTCGIRERDFLLDGGGFWFDVMVVAQGLKILHL